MSSDHTNALLLGGAALAAAAGGFLYRQTHQAAHEEKDLTYESALDLDKEIDLETARVEKVKLATTEDVALKTAVLESEMQPAVTTSTKARGAIVVEEELPAVIHEVAHPVLKEDIQPIVHRDIKKTEVHQVVQPIYEEYVAPVKEINKELASEIRPTLVEDSSSYKAEFDRSLEVNTFARDELVKETIVKPAIVEEVITKEIVEVVQPVVHRDTIEATFVHTSAPVYEKIIEKPVLIHEVREPIIMTHEQVEKLNLPLNRTFATSATREEPVLVEKTTIITEEKVLPKSALGKAPLADPVILK